MAKELLLYFHLSNWSVDEMIKSINEVMEEEVTMRVNSPGGDVFASWGLFAKVSEHGNITIKVDGLAASGAGNLLMYAKRVECLDVSRFMMHRADAYAETPEQKQLLNDINADLRKKMEAKFTPELFKEVTGHTIEEMFNPETRVNIWLTAAQAKKLGLVSKVNKLNPAIEKDIAKAMADYSMSIAAHADSTTPPPPTPTPTQINKNMTLTEFKAQHPALFNEVYALGVTDGVKKEKDRVEALMVFAEVDPKKVKEMIEKGEELTTKAMAEFQLAATSEAYLAKLTKDSTGDVSTTEDPKGAAAPSAKAKEVLAFEAEVNKGLGIK
jgi:ATP-dependent Clp protease, protease subunit